MDTHEWAKKMITDLTHVIDKEPEDDTLDQNGAYHVAGGYIAQRLKQLTDDLPMLIYKGEMYTLPRYLAEEVLKKRQELIQEGHDEAYGEHVR